MGAEGEEGRVSREEDLDRAVQILLKWMLPEMSRQYAAAGHLKDPAFRAVGRVLLDPSVPANPYQRELGRLWASDERLAADAQVVERELRGVMAAAASALSARHRDEIYSEMLSADMREALVTAQSMERRLEGAQRAAAEDRARAQQVQGQLDSALAENTRLTREVRELRLAAVPRSTPAPAPSPPPAPAPSPPPPAPEKDPVAERFKLLELD